MSIGEQIETIVASMTGNNLPPQLVTIKEAYTDLRCDITTETGTTLQRIKCSTQPITDTKGLLTYENGDQDKPFVIVFESAETIINSLGLGKFKISDEGDLYVELPNGVDNIFKIENNNLYVNIPTGRENNYNITTFGDIEYEREEV